MNNGLLTSNSASLKTKYIWRNWYILPNFYTLQGLISWLVASYVSLLSPSPLVLTDSRDTNKAVLSGKQMLWSSDSLILGLPNMFSLSLGQYHKDMLCSLKPLNFVSFLSIPPSAFNGLCLYPTLTFPVIIY